MFRSSSGLPFSETETKFSRCFEQKANQGKDIRRSGAEGRNRTADTRLFRPLLYRLSYLGTAVDYKGSDRQVSTKKSRNKCPATLFGPSIIREFLSRNGVKFLVLNGISNYSLVLPVPFFPFGEKPWPNFFIILSNVELLLRFHTREGSGMPLAIDRQGRSPRNCLGTEKTRSATPQLDAQRKMKWRGEDERRGKEGKIFKFFPSRLGKPPRP